MSSHRRLLTVFVAILLIAVALPAFAVAPAVARQDSPTTPTVEPLVSLVQQVGPAVVTVVNLQTGGGLGATDGGFDETGRLQPAGSGTGFIYQRGRLHRDQLARRDRRR